MTGFCDGAATFTFSRSGRQIALYFAVKMPGHERPLLEALRAYFGCGSIYGAPKSGAMLRVTRHDELRRVTQHFDRYPLHSQKRASYEIWRGMVDLKREFRAPNREALEELALSLSASWQ